MSPTKRTKRERIWDTLRAAGGQPISLNTLAFKVQVSSDGALRYIKVLHKFGYISLSNPGSIRESEYVLIKDTGAKAPDPKEGQTGITSRDEAMWATIRIVKRLDARELSALACQGGVTVSLNNAKAYLTLLNKAGYLDVVESARAHKLTVYRLKPHMNTGPKPPQTEVVKTVRDANSGTVMLRESSTSALDCLEEVA